MKGFHWNLSDNGMCPLLFSHPFLSFLLNRLFLLFGFCCCFVSIFVVWGWNSGLAFAGQVLFHLRNFSSPLTLVVFEIGLSFCPVQPGQQLDCLKLPAADRMTTHWQDFAVQRGSPELYVWFLWTTLLQIPTPLAAIALQVWDMGPSFQSARFLLLLVLTSKWEKKGVKSFPVPGPRTLLLC
jgi:hypothetical protein